MMFLRRSMGGIAAIIAAGLLMLSPSTTRAAGEFPFDRELILDAKRIGGLKRLPILTVEPNGNAVVDLWCKAVQAHVEMSDSAFKIEIAALPEELPSMMVPGQCSPERLQADQDMIAALTQVTGWRWQGDAVVLSGPADLRFHASSH